MGAVTCIVKCSAVFLIMLFSYVRFAEPVREKTLWGKVCSLLFDHVTLMVAFAIAGVIVYPIYVNIEEMLPIFGVSKAVSLAVMYLILIDLAAVGLLYITSKVTGEFWNEIHEMTEEPFFLQVARNAFFMILLSTPLFGYEGLLQVLGYQTQSCVDILTYRAGLPLALLAFRKSLWTLAM